MLLHLDNLPPRTAKGELLRLLIETGGIGRAQVGRIDLRGAGATIDVPADWGERLARALDGVALRDRRLRVRASGALAGSAEAADHFHALGRLLELESRAERRQLLERLQALGAADAERTGECLVGLVVIEESSGLGGRCVLTLAKRNRSLALPWNR